VVLENGQPQPIVGFVPVDIPDAPPAPATWMREVVSDVRSNDLGDGRLFVIVMDDATLPPDARIASQARAIGRMVVDRMGPADLAAVVFTLDNRHSVDFTPDRARLRRAIDRMRPGFVYDINHVNSDSIYYRQTVNTLDRVTEYLSTVPERRKAVVFVSTGVPVDMAEVATLVGIGPTAGGMGERDLAEDLVAHTQEAFGRTLQSAFLRAQDGHVNIHSIDPSGVGGLSFFLETQPIFGQRRGLVESIDQGKLHRDFLEMVSAVSGGRAVVDTNDFTEGVRQIFRENSSYYLLGYASTRPPDDESVRHVEVRVRRPDAEVRTRSAYFDERAVATDDVEFVTTDLELADAIAEVLPDPGLAMRAAVAAFPQPDSDAASLAIIVGLERPVAPVDDGPSHETIELLVGAFTTEGEARGTLRRTLRIPVADDAAGPTQYDLLTRLDLEPGRYQLRIAARNVALETSGSVFYEVEVPDFHGDALSLSDVALDATPGALAGPEAAVDWLPLVPTSRREFQATDEVRGFVRVAQGGRRPQPVTVEVRITDGTDTVVHRVTREFVAEAFTEAGDPGYAFDLPLANLRTGRYLLTVEATRGARTARRDVVFEVQ
jgi:VWFA-related protein